MPHQLKLGFFLGIPVAKPGCSARACGSRLVLPSGCRRLLLHPLLLCAAPSDGEAELLQVGDSVEVHESASHDKHVEQLVGVELQRETPGFSWGSSLPPRPTFS